MKKIIAQVNVGHFIRVEPKSEDELKTYIKEYEDRYWILKDTGHVKNSPLCFVNNTTK